MSHFKKPAEGSWTAHYPHLGTAPVSYEDSISPEHYEIERKAIFARTWLNVGRVEQLPRTGSYFTKELDAARTSVIVVRGSEGEVRAFHNICRHRGNKLVWQDYPNEEVSGTCRQFTCKYHGWRYALDGALTFVQQEDEFFDLEREDFGLVPVQTETWEGFVFVNLDPANETSLADYLGRFGKELSGYPFGAMTQVYKYRAEVGSNWKLFIDAFAEFYHLQSTIGSVKPPTWPDASHTFGCMMMEDSMPTTSSRWRIMSFHQRSRMFFLSSAPSGP